MTETQATYMIDLLERILFIAGKFEAVLDAEQEDEAEVIRKLAAGVSVEPDGWRTQEYIGAPSQQEPYYNADTFTTAIAAARVQALEEAAKECDRTASDYKGMFAEDEALYIAATDCANEIRALIGEKTC